MPLCALTGRIPVGSPISADLALGLPNSANVFAPSIEDSSSAVARMMSGSLNS